MLSLILCYISALALLHLCYFSASEAEAQHQHIVSIAELWLGMVRKNIS